jgi:hypothetical protein
MAWRCNDGLCGWFLLQQLTERGFLVFGDHGPFCEHCARVWSVAKPGEKFGT